jgi:hypothetical protein
MRFRSTMGREGSSDFRLPPLTRRKMDAMAAIAGCCDGNSWSVKCSLTNDVPGAALAMPGHGHAVPGRRRLEYRGR